MENPTVSVRAIISFPSLEQEIRFKGAPTGKYGTQLSNLSEAAVERLESLGVTMKSKPDDAYSRGQFIECKSQYPFNNNGKYPVLLNEDGTEFDGNPASIGYGTEVIAKVRAFKGKDGVVRPSLVNMKIVDLVTPEASVSDDEVL